MSPLTEQLVRPRHRRHQRPCSTSPSSSRTRTTARAQLPGNTTLSWDGTEESRRGRAHQDRSSPRRSGSPPSRAPTSRQSARNEPATLIERHEDAAPRWLAAVRDFDRRGRLGRPAHRRAVRPTRELRDQQRRRPRPDLLDPPAPARTSAAPGAAGTTSTAATRSTGCGHRWASRTGRTSSDAHDLLHGRHARRVHRRRRGLARLAVRPGPGRGRPAQLRGVHRRDRRAGDGLARRTSGSWRTTSAPARAGPTTCRPG